MNRTSMEQTLRRGAAFLPLFALLLCACGKAGMPTPKKTQDTFTIAGASVAVMAGCLAASGTVSGAVRNVDSIAIEVAAISSEDDCPGCPFVAQEYEEFPASAARLDRETGKFSFSYCPSAPAPMYRWRLVGKNVFLGLPHAMTTPQMAIMETSAQ